MMFDTMPLTSRSARQRAVSQLRRQASESY
jgi:hypothetical protein